VEEPTEEEEEPTEEEEEEPTEEEEEPTESIKSSVLELFFFFISWGDNTGQVVKKSDAGNKESLRKREDMSRI
jgi:hypothetical protein